MVEGEVYILTGPISLGMLAESFGSIIAKDNYIIFSDSDGDGDVDGGDLHVFRQNY